jgi:hypothetical protein
LCRGFLALSTNKSFKKYFGRLTKFLKDENYIRFRITIFVFFHIFSCEKLQCQRNNLGYLGKTTVCDHIHSLCVVPYLLFVQIDQ